VGPLHISLYAGQLAHWTFAINANKVICRNFLGEKITRRVIMHPGVDVETSKNVKDEIQLLGNDLENVSQSAADIQQICKVRNKDIRKVHLYQHYFDISVSNRCASSWTVCTCQKEATLSRSDWYMHGKRTHGRFHGILCIIRQYQHYVRLVGLASRFKLTSVDTAPLRIMVWCFLTFTIGKGPLATPAVPKPGFCIIGATCVFFYGVFETVWGY
jgi:hypothetical protein